MKNVIFALLFLLVCQAKLHAQTSYYEGKTIRIIIGSSVGGGYDLWVRVMARHLGKYLLSPRWAPHELTPRAILFLAGLSQHAGCFSPQHIL